MHAARWLTVVSRDVAALEATVVDAAQPGVMTQRLPRRLRDSWRAACAVGGAKVEIGQAAGKEARHLSANRVSIQEEDEAMTGPQRLDLGGQCLVIGTEILLDTRADLAAVGR